MRVDDLEVYRKLFDLAFEVHELTMAFPKFEMYELGSQLRRSSNSAPANLAEGFGNKHTNLYTESINRSQGEIRETLHHLRVAQRKQYFSDRQLQSFITRYEGCSKMLFRLHHSLEVKKK